MKSTESQIEILAPADCSSSLRNAINKGAESINRGLARARVTNPRTSKGNARAASQEPSKKTPLYVIMQKKGECNGCGRCAKAAPNFWSKNEKGEFTLNDVCRVEGPYECGEGGKDDGFCLLTAVKACPLGSIHLF